MKWHVPLGVLIVLLVVGLTTTLLNINRADADTLKVPLGVRHAASPSARELDLAAVTAYERNQFSKELKQRLNKPRRNIVLSGFYADACEVSQLEWEQFVEWTSGQPGFDTTTENHWLQSSSTGHRIAGRLTSPASGVNFKGASAYCSAAGGRLPFAEEFEAMASGEGSRLYPWGDEFKPDAWPFNSAERNSSQACGMHEATSTPFGIHDLANNAMEWGQGPMYAQTLQFQPSIHGAPAARRSHRELYALNAAWLQADPSLKSHHLGFRCVYGKHPLILPWRKRLQDVVQVPAADYEVGLPDESRIPLFLANMPPIRGINLRDLIQSDSTASEELTVDRCEVRRSAYAKFLSDPLVQLGMFSNENQPAGVEFTPLDWIAQLEDSSFPVYGVNWWAADAYARWSGGRLPTVEEWRQIAAGSAGFTYPWGMSYDEESAQTGDDASSRLSSCGSSQNDVTLAGVVDLGGNLSEWTRSLSARNSRLSMWVQGGNWLLPGTETTKSLFGRAVPLTYRSKSVGFRVVYD